MSHEFRHNDDFYNAYVKPSDTKKAFTKTAFGRKTTKAVKKTQAERDQLSLLRTFQGYNTLKAALIRERTKLKEMLQNAGLLAAGRLVHSQALNVARIASDNYALGHILQGDPDDNRRETVANALETVRQGASALLNTAFEEGVDAREEQTARLIDTLTSVLKTITHLRGQVEEILDV